MNLRRFAFAAPLLLVLPLLGACSSSSGDVGEIPALGPDSGPGCDSHVTGRCDFPDGTCAEYSGDVAPGESDSDPRDCASQGGIYLVDACPRVATIGACVAPDGSNVDTEGPGLVCDYYVTTWLPDGYRGGTFQNPCADVGGAFTAE